MLWLSRPPYLRWLGAVAILGAGSLDRGPTPAEVEHPYARIDLPAGSVVDEENVEWRRVPGGVLPPVELGGLALVDIPAGQPLSPALVATDSIEPPENWWALEVPLPPGALPGGAVRLVLLPGLGVDGTPASGRRGGHGGYARRSAQPGRADRARRHTRRGCRSGGGGRGRRPRRGADRGWIRPVRPVPIG